MFKYFFVIICLFASMSLSAGSLYTFNQSDIQAKALNWLRVKEKEISKLELKPDGVSPYVRKSGELEVLVYFSYKSKAEYGFNYVCIHMNENGELLGLKKGIEAYKNSLGMYYPVNSSCE